MTSLNYKSASVEIRENFTFQKEELAEAIKLLKQTKSILECVIVSTCNRTEVYAVVDQLHTGRYYIKTFLSNWFGIAADEFVNYLTIYENQVAVDHLFRVTCGLNSMVVGETQILGQIRESFFLASDQNATGTIFNQLFKQAITVAKRAHSETSIGEAAVSVSYAAVELGKKIFGDFNSKHVLIFGAGKMSELTVKHLYANGVEKVTVINRTMDKAVSIADKFQGEARPVSQLKETLEEVDIFITSTGAKDYVVSKELVQSTLKNRKGRPLFIVDIAVPRDIDPSVAELDNIYLYDIDDLEGIVAANLSERRREAMKIGAMIDTEVTEFQSWLNTLGVVPIIAALRQKAVTVQEDTMESIERKLPNLTEREKKLIRKHMKSIINQMLRDPIVAAKEMAAEPNAEEALALFTKIFAIESEQPVERQINATVKQSEKKIEIFPYSQDVALRS